MIMITKMKKILALWSFLCLALFCSEQPTDPPPDEKELCEITDTTSHAFTWRVDTLGAFGSVLMDVEAVSENEVWACGEIELKERPEVDRYNVVRWNGSEYEFLKAKAYGGVSLAEAILPFPDGTVWVFMAGVAYSFWNGDSFKTEYFDGEVTGRVMDAWGTATDDFYVVGQFGSIAHYDGTSFTPMESGTDITLFEIQGYVDPQTNKQHIWVLGFVTGRSVVLKLEDGVWKHMWEMEMLQNNFRFPQSLFIDDSETVVMSVWSGLDQRGRLYCFDQNDFTNYRLLAEHSAYSRGFGGTGINDLFVAGINQYNIVHFNGSTVFQYSELRAAGLLTEIATLNDKIYIVGDTAGGAHAVIMHGW